MLGVFDMLTEEQINNIGTYTKVSGDRQYLAIERSELESLKNQAKEAIWQKHDKERLYDAIYKLLDYEGWTRIVDKYPTKEDGEIIVYGMRHNDFCDKKIYETDWNDIDQYPYVITCWKRKE